MGGQLSGFYRIQIKLIPFKFLPSYVCLLKVAEIEFKSQKTYAGRAQRATADYKHMA